MLRKPRGQSVVEFALVAPIFFALIWGIIAAGILFFQASAVNDAAQGAARAALVELSFTSGTTTGSPSGLSCSAADPGESGSTGGSLGSRPIETAAQQAANIVPVDPDPLCEATTAVAGFCGGVRADTLVQTPVGSDATVMLCLVPAPTTPACTDTKTDETASEAQDCQPSYSVEVNYTVKPLAPLLGASIKLTSTSTLQEQAEPTS